MTTATSSKETNITGTLLISSIMSISQISWELVVQVSSKEENRTEDFR